MRVRTARGTTRLIAAAATLFAPLLCGACDLSPQPVPPSSLSVSSNGGAPGGASASGSGAAGGGEPGSNDASIGIITVGSSGTTAASGSASIPPSGAGGGASGSASSGAASGEITPASPEDAAAPDAGTSMGLVDAEAMCDVEDVDASDAPIEADAEPLDATCGSAGRAADAPWACE